MTLSGSLFRQGGDLWSGMSDNLFLLARGPRKNARDVLHYVVLQERLGKNDERLTDVAIAEALGCSRRTVQRGLHALHVVLGGLGKAIIDRVRTHGRRIITFTRGLASSGRAASPPSPPGEQEKTTIGELSSSPPEKAVGTGEAPPELVDRACKLVPGATPGRVADVVGTYGAEWTSRALDRVESRNRKPGNKPVKSWGFVLKTMANWRQEGGPPPEGPRPAAPPAAPPPPKAKPESPEPWTAKGLAQMLEQCLAPSRSVSSFARGRVLKAIEDGLIPAELMATIPAELRGPESPRAP